ncbi:hypothetical protein BH09GEM1_BH09GEM1_11020 [soil metagenome]
MTRNFARFMIEVATGMVANGMPATAQVKASEIGTMSEVIDGTTITMEYSRPRVRGRNPLFGSTAGNWGVVWTPGANWAMTLETDKAITLDGRAVPRGKYSVWFVVRESGDWTMVLDPKWKQFHNTPPDSSPAQLRFAVHTRKAQFTRSRVGWGYGTTISSTSPLFAWRRTCSCPPCMTRTA